MADPIPVILFPGSNPQPAPGVPSPPTSAPPPGPPSSSSSGGASATPISNFEIKQKLLRPALTSNYICRFQPPGNMTAAKNPDGNPGFLKEGEELFPGSDYSVRGNQELIEISCSEASLPGSSLITNEINDDHTGVTERLAYRRQYDDRIDFTFYVDHRYGIINFFERWISYCVGENAQPNLSNRDYFYRVNFPEDYQTDNLYITKFERDYQSQLEYKFIGAYPISITSMPVSYDSSDLLKCSVSFSYIRYVRKISSISTETEPSPPTPAPGVPPITPRVPSNPIEGQVGDFFTGEFNQPVATLGLQPGNINPGSGGLVV